MPVKGDAAARPPEPPTEDDGATKAQPRYRRPDPALVRWAANRALVRPGRPFPSQAALLQELLSVLRRRDPLFALGERRMREILVDTPGLHLKVRYAERPTRRPLTRCPVCGRAVRPIRNRTLWADRVTLGYRCPHCGYWTHLRRRVPVRYLFLPAGIDGSPRPEPAAEPPN